MDDNFELMNLPDDNPVSVLTNKERAFVIDYMTDYDHQRVGKALGMAHGTAIWYTRKPHIRDAILYLQSIERTELMISKSMVLEKYKDILHSNMTEGNTSEAKKVLDSITKLMGYNAPTKTEQTVKGNINHNHMDAHDIEEKIKLRIEQMQRDSITVKPRDVTESS